MSMQMKIGFFLVFCEIVGLEGFSYEDPDKEWGEEYPTCNGGKQSPVDIELDFGMVPQGKVLWNNYASVPGMMKITNTGHTIQVNPIYWNDDEIPYLSGGPLDGEYVMEQFHFHWGQNDSVGCEHRVQGASAALELQMVHWKREYGSLEEAITKPDGLAVVAILYETSFQKHHPDMESDDVIVRIVGELGNLQRENDESELEPFALCDIEAVNSGDIMGSYDGSLTTPGCDEVVTWLVALKWYQVTSEDMEKIRAIELAHGDDHNNRPRQPLNGREIVYYESN